MKTHKIIDLGGVSVTSRELIEYLGNTGEVKKKFGLEYDSTVSNWKDAGISHPWLIVFKLLYKKEIANLKKELESLRVKS